MNPSKHYKYFVSCLKQCVIHIDHQSLIQLCHHSSIIIPCSILGMTPTRGHEQREKKVRHPSRPPPIVASGADLAHSHCNPSFTFPPRNLIPVLRRSSLARFVELELVGPKDECKLEHEEKKPRDPNLVSSPQRWFPPGAHPLSKSASPSPLAQEWPRARPSTYEVVCKQCTAIVLDSWVWGAKCTTRQRQSPSPIPSLPQLLILPKGEAIIPS
jgi:hypothetical protein